MKILHVLCQKPGFTGSGFYLRALIEQSHRAGHQTASVVGLSAHDEVDLERVYPVRFETEALPFPVVGMSDVMPYPSTRWSQLSESDLSRYEAAFEKVLVQAVNEFQPDVIHCHHFWLLTALTRRLFANHKVVASCHGTGLRQQEKLPHIKARCLPSLSRLNHGYCLTPSQIAPLSYLEGRTCVVGAGFDSEVFHSRGRPSAPSNRVLYAGKIDPSKGCRELLSAAQPLLRQGMTLSVAGAGHGGEADLLSAKAESLGVEMLGRISQADLAEEMRRSQVFVLPSYYEGLPLVVAEALSCGCRIVSTSLPGLLDWIPLELIESGWVRLVALPKLSNADQPNESEIPFFVERLGQALKIQLNCSQPPPESLEVFLRQSSWSGVFEKIASGYKA